VESGNGKVPHVELKVSTRSQGGRTIVSLGGEIDLYTAPRLHGELDNVLASGPAQIVVDMSGVEFCDSTGMNVLLGAYRRAREMGGDLEDPPGYRPGDGLHCARRSGDGRWPVTARP
jgi:anti-anti-sigma factor